MKKNIFLTLLLSILCFPFTFAQKIITPISNSDYDNLKFSGKLDSQVQYMLLPSKFESDVTQDILSRAISHPTLDTSGGVCSCIVPLDATFSNAEFTNGTAPDYRNDDGSTTSKNLPFNFCMYGTNYSSVFINNNGNITFVSGTTIFSSTGFPNNTDIMIAPFWADVDTRNLSSGIVHYKITPTYMIVKWEAVGYYNSMADKLNTFQLIITNGVDPILPTGKNIAFCYGDMNWTTGAASQGLNGFNTLTAGISSTVGVNKGDGINFIQIGRFGFAGSAYFGPYALNSQIDYLDFKSYYFDVCGTSSNLPPISTTNSACGDTLTICGLGDTLVLSSIFLAPENNQSVTITASAPTLGSNFSILNSTNGVVGQVDFMVVATTALAGYHIITITATDNGTPALSTSVTYVINIVNNPIPDPLITISPQPACASLNPTLTLTNCAAFSSYIWNTGNNTCSFSTNQSGQYFVTVGLNGCFKTSFANAEILANPSPIITGPLNYCNLLGTTLVVIPGINDASPYTNIVWSPGLISNDTLFPAFASTYTVSVTDTNGCIGTATAVVTSAPPVVTISASPANICPGDSTTLTASISGATYLWSPGGATTQSIQAFVSGPYTVTVTANGCSSQTTFNLAAANTPTVTITGNISICQGNTTTLTAHGAPAPLNYTFLWSSGTIGASAIVSTSGIISVYGTNTNTGCKDTASINVTVNPKPVLSLSSLNNNVICSGLANTITCAVAGGTSAFTYSWSPNISTTSTANVLTASTYSVIVTDSKNCKDTAIIILTLSNPNVSLNATDVTICPGQCDTLIAIGSGATGISYSWTPNFISINDSVVNCQAGNYEVFVIDVNGCKDSASLIVTQNIAPVADFSFTPASPQQPNVPISFTDASNVSSGAIMQWVWSFGDGNNSALQNPSHSYGFGGTYAVTLLVVASNGCIDTVAKFYTIDAQVYAPNIITPNGDSVNECLKFKGLEYYPNNKIAIFNRWGQKIYDKENYTNDWNGDGHKEGTYYYILDVPNAKPQSTFSSYFMIVR